MITRKLYLQIYATIIASLLAVVVVSVVLFNLIGRDNLDRHVFEISGKLAWMSLAPASADQATQQRAVSKLGRELNIDISLYDGQRNLLASHGRVSPPPRRAAGKRRGWHRAWRSPGWVLRLPDDRFLVVDLRRRAPIHPALGLLLYLTLISLAVLAVAYPFVRRLTRRLENLQHSVVQIGSGDLSARAEVKGRDEVASLAASFNESAERITHLIASNKMLLANASHELRTPLARIRLGIEMANKGLNAKRREQLQQDIAELDGLIEEILLMSRLDTDQKPHLGDDVDVLALAAEECARYEGCDLMGTTAPMRGNEKLLRRLLRNLLDNAFKHGAAPVTVAVASDLNATTLTVRDAGPGIPPDAREHVFDPFFRARGKQNVPGFGLGLSLVRQIAELHDGEVTILEGRQSAIQVRFALP